MLGDNVSKNSSYSIVIAGGGIGGLSTAMGLANRGFKVTVLEQAPEFGEVGAGIQIGPNAFHAMDYLGVGDECRAKAIYIDNLVMMDAVSGDNVAKIPVDGPFRERFGNPYAVVHRADLHGVFADACVAHPNVTMLTNVRVIGYETTDNGAQVMTSDGDIYAGDAVIGCDGVRSKIREMMTGGEAAGDHLRTSGHVAYRSVLPIEEMPEELRWNAATLWAGPKCHLVHYPLQGWKTFNIVATFQTEISDVGTNEPGTREEILKRFGKIADLPLSLLQKPKNWRRWVLADRDPIENWTDGNVTLLGDAAHPTHQYYAQGACMAMEDAVCMADRLDKANGDFNAAFLDYQKNRMTRVYRVVLTSREIGKHLYHPSGMHRQIRNEVMRAKSADDWYDIVQWLYGGTGLEANGLNGDKGF